MSKTRYVLSQQCVCTNNINIFIHVLIFNILIFIIYNKFTIYRYNKFTIYYKLYMERMLLFKYVFENLTRYRSKDNFV